jgi:hypothetical protein
LKNDDWEIRYTAAQALKEIGWKPRDKNEEIYYYIAMEDWESLVKLGKLAVELLIKNLQIVRTDYRWNQEFLPNVVETLGKITDERAVNTLIKTLENPGSTISHSAGKALRRIGWQPKNDFERIYYLIAIQEWDELVKLGKPVVEFLSQILQDIKRDDQQEIVRVLGEIGDKRAAESVLTWLFEHPHDNDHIRNLSFSLPILFNDYASLILKSISYKKIQHSDSSTYHKTGSYEYVMTDSLSAIEKLRDIKTPISTNILYLLLKVKDIKVEVVYSCVSSSYGELSFQKQRDVAKEELTRRGNPVYDPSAYLDEKAWIL